MIEFQNFLWVGNELKLPPNSTIVSLNSRPFSHAFEKQAWYLARAKNVNHAVLISNLKNEDQILQFKKVTGDNIYIFNDEEQIQTTAINSNTTLKNWKMNQFEIEKY